MARLFAAMRAEFDLEPDAEITVECAPGQIADATLEAMAAAGVNRVSLGVQSFVDREAQVSGRLHSRAMVRGRSAAVARGGDHEPECGSDCGAGRADACLMGASRSTCCWTRVCRTPACTCWRWMRIRGWGARCWPAERAITRGWCRATMRLRGCMRRAIERLARAGLRQYEISNFGRRGFQSRHNLRYWERRPYLGLGLDASSMLREEGRDGSGYVLRSTTTDDLKAYLGDPEPGTGLGPWGGEPAETAWLSPERQHEEAWFVGLRLNSGVKLAALRREFGREPVAQALAAVERLVEDEMLTSDAKTVRLTARGRLLSNDVFQEFLGVAEIADAARVPRAQGEAHQVRAAKEDIHR